jgi:branched-chain amino acid transport system substrate-binding protein
VRLVFVAGLDAAAGRIITQARGVGMDARFIGGDGLEPLVEMGAHFNGTMVGVLYHPEMSPAARQFATAFRAKFRREPDSSAATAYDAVQLIARALREGSTSRSAIREYLEQVGRNGGSPALAGVSGPVAFDANGDPVGKPVALVRIENGRFRLQSLSGAAR